MKKTLKNIIIAMVLAVPVIVVFVCTLVLGGLTYNACVTLLVGSLIKNILSLIFSFALTVLFSALFVFSFAGYMKTTTSK